MIRTFVLFCIAGLIAQTLRASVWEDDCRYLIDKLSNVSVCKSELLSEDIFKNIPVSSDIFKSVKIDEDHVEEPKTFGELLDYLAEINRFLRDSAALPIKQDIAFQYGDSEPLTLKLPPIGEGKHTLVYEIKQPDQEAGKRVYKLTKPDVASLRATLADIASAPFWFDREGASFYVPPYFHCHPGGLFRVAEKSEGISLTKVLLYSGILSFDEGLGFGENASLSACLSAEKRPELSFLKWVQNLKTIKQGVMDIVETVQSNPLKCPSLSPNNIYITFSQRADCLIDQVQQVVLVDIGVSNSPVEKIKEYESIKSFDDYLELSEKSLKSYLKSDNYRYDFDSMCYWLRKGRESFNSYL